MKANLKARIAKLEASIAAKDAGFPSVVFGEFDRTEDEIVGVGSNGQNVARQSGKSVEEMIDRAQRELRQKIVFLIYAENGNTGDTCIVFPKDDYRQT